MSKFKDQDQLRKYLQQDLLGEIPIFFNQCIVRQKKEEEAERYVSVTSFQTNQYQVRPYHKVVSKII